MKVQTQNIGIQLKSRAISDPAKVLRPPKVPLFKEKTLIVVESNA
jgi:hypothetical protein